MSPHYLVNAQLFHLTEGMLHSSISSLMTLKKASGLALMALKRTGCDVWQMECQASNVTANIQSGHFLLIYMLPVFNCIVHHAVLKFSPRRNTSATCPYRRLVLNTHEKLKNLCILQGSAVTFFRCSGKRVTVCFLLR